MKNSFIKNYLFFKKILNFNIKKKILLLVIFSIFNSFVELIGIASIFPAIILSNNSSGDFLQKNFFVFNYFDLNNENIFFLIIFSIFLFGLSIIINYFNTIYANSISFEFNNYVSNKFIKTILNREYYFFNQSSISKRINQANQQLSWLNECFNATIIMFSRFIFLFLILLFIFLTFPSTIVPVILIIIFYFLLTFLLKKKFIQVGQELNNSQNILTQLVISSFEGFKEIAQLNLKEKLLADYSKAKNRFEKTQFLNTIYSTSAKPILEIVILVIFFIALILYKFFFLNDFEKIIPILGFFLIAFIRVGPVINLIYQNYVKIKNFGNVIDQFSKEFFIKKNYLGPANKIISNSDLNSKKSDEKINKIILKRIDYISSAKIEILKNVNAVFKKNEISIITGASGSGKSTLLNLISFFFNANKGKIIFYNKNNNIINSKNDSRNNVLTLSQKPIFFNCSVKENITLKKKLNMKEEKHYLSCLKKANIKGLLTKKRILGEFHNNFSGGELQRLAIARALYQDKDIILFDESFSGLDYEVKISIMKMLKMIKEKIIIIVTHDLSLCSYVDKVYLLKNRRLFLQKN